MQNKVLCYERPKKEFSVGNIREKELIRAYKVIDLSGGVASDGEAQSFVDCRIYMGRSTSAHSVYAIVWTTNTDGKGKAGGYGYDKDSAAVGSAIRDAGYMLEKRIDGVGLDAVKEALMAIAVFNGCKSPAIVSVFA